jgi:hypothetical protein
MTTFANKQSSNKQVKLRIHFGLLLRIKQKINLFINDEITELMNAEYRNFKYFASNIFGWLLSTKYQIFDPFYQLDRGVCMKKQNEMRSEYLKLRAIIKSDHRINGKKKERKKERKKE